MRANIDMQLSGYIFVVIYQLISNLDLLKYFYFRSKNGVNRPFSDMALECLDLSLWQPNFPNLFRFRYTLTGTHRLGPRISLSLSLGDVKVLIWQYTYPLLGGIESKWPAITGVR